MLTPDGEAAVAFVLILPLSVEKGAKNRLYQESLELFGHVRASGLTSS